MKNILFIKLAAIGDAILLIPTLRMLKQAFPLAKITFMCSDINISIIEKIPYVDEIINCNVHDFLKNPFKFYTFMKDLRKVKYELIIDAGQWERINSVITCFARKDYSVGFKTKGQWKHVINDAVVAHSKIKHELENFTDLLVPIGIIPPGKKLSFDELQLEFFLTEEDRVFRDKFWKDNDLELKTVICFHPGCGENGKPREWDINNYIELGKRIHKFDENVIIIITGTKIESDLCEKLYENIKDYAVYTAGKYTLEQTAAIVERAKLMVCSNTGILHISSCVGTKTIGLHGPTNPVKWGAYSKNAVVIQSDKFCSPCLYLGHDYGCKNPTCMPQITVEEVYMALIKALQPQLFKEELINQ